MAEGPRPRVLGTATTDQATPAERWADAAAFLLLVLGVVAVPLWFWPWASDVFVGPKFDVLRLLTAGAAAAAVAWLVAAQRPTFRLRTADLAVLAFLLLNVIAYVLSVDRRTSLFGEPLQQFGLVTAFALSGAYAVARITVKTQRRLTALYVAAASAGTMAAIYGAAQMVGADPFWSDLPKARVFSTIGQPNWLAAYFVLTIPLTVSLAGTTTRWWIRLLGLAASLLQATVLIATLSRSGYVGLVAAAIGGALLAVKRGDLRALQSMRRSIATVVGVIALGFVIVVGVSWARPDVAPGRVVERAGSVFEIGGFDAGRYVALWEVGFAIAVDHPLTGAGQDTYPILFPDYRDRVLSESYANHFARFRPESPHNVYLSIAAGAGFPALAAYLVLVGTSLTLIVSSVRRDGPASILLVGLGAAVAGHLATDWFMTIDLSGSWLFWALLGAGLAVIDTKPVAQGEGAAVTGGLVRAQSIHQATERRRGPAVVLE